MSENVEKEKIINDVDVSMCDVQCANGDCGLYYAPQLLNADKPEFKYSYMCSDNHACYYKQLQRIRAEYKKFAEYLPIAARLVYFSVSFFTMSCNSFASKPVIRLN